MWYMAAIFVDMSCSIPLTYSSTFGCISSKMKVTRPLPPCGVRLALLKSAETCQAVAISQSQYYSLNIHPHTVIQ